MQKKQESRRKKLVKSIAKNALQAESNNFKKSYYIQVSKSIKRNIGTAILGTQVNEHFENKNKLSDVPVE